MVHSSTRRVASAAAAHHIMVIGAPRTTLEARPAAHVQAQGAMVARAVPSITSTPLEGLRTGRPCPRRGATRTPKARLSMPEAARCLTSRTCAWSTRSRTARSISTLRLGVTKAAQRRRSRGRRGTGTLKTCWRSATRLASITLTARMICCTTRSTGPRRRRATRSYRSPEPRSSSTSRVRWLILSRISASRG